MQVPLSVSRIEAATLTVWPALRQAYDGLWLWRYARGYTKRANSIHCLDAADGAYAELRLQKLVELSERHGIPPIFRVTPLTAPEVLEVLEGLVWEVFDTSMVMATEMPAVDFPIGTNIRYFDPRDPEWYKAQAQMSGSKPEMVEALKAILELIPCDVQGILAYHKAGLPVAAALAAVTGGIGVYLNVVTHPNARGHGYGRAVMGAALNWARAAGATHSVIQLLAENAPAINLYTSLGFGEVYPYHYCQPADGADR